MQGRASMAGSGMQASKWGAFQTTSGQLVTAAVVGGTASELGGGKFANGAVTGAYTMLFNHIAHRTEDQQKTQSGGDDREFPSFSELWENYQNDVNGVHQHPSSDPYPNQCAIRLGSCLQKSGVDMSNYKTGPMTSEGYPRGAKSLADWLWSNYGRPKIITQTLFQSQHWDQTGSKHSLNPVYFSCQ
ncbi:MAG: T6SS effector amidase Tae4 family protein [Mangrovibacterium sp.]